MGTTEADDLTLWPSGVLKKAVFGSVESLMRSLTVQVVVDLSH